MKIIFKKTLHFFHKKSRIHRKIRLEFRIWKKVIHTFGPCKHSNILTTMNQVRWTEITKCSIDHIIQAHHSVPVEVVAVCQTCPFGIHTDNWYQSVKPDTASAILIQFPASENKFRHIQMMTTI